MAVAEGHELADLAVAEGTTIRAGAGVPFAPRNRVNLEIAGRRAARLLPLTYQSSEAAS
jgi:hypothetical protein